ncbi:MAG: DPP IV N-terminal domain-containing protein [Pseudobacter sp.]|uniref:S9 family peptidase n=1 Tax=Pseudobacter sp. TaxID=2045420 RepID=UPI003F80192A
MFLFIAYPVSAQRTLSFHDAYEGDESTLTAKLPTFLRWGLQNQLIFEDRDQKILMFDPATRKVSEYKLRSPARAALPWKTTDMPISSPDGKFIAYLSNNDIFLKDLHTQQTRRLTTDGNDSTLNGIASFVYKEEITGPNTLRWSPNSQYLAFMRFDESNVPVYSMYIPEGQYGRIETQRYPMPGNTNPRVKIGIIHIPTGKLVWADFPDADQYFGRLSFTPTNKLLLKWMPRQQQEVKVFEVNPDNGAKKQIYEEHSSTWLDINNCADITYIDSGRHFILASERTGFRHYYLYRADGTALNAITSGDYSTANYLRLDEKNHVLYFAARKENSARLDVYSVQLDGKNMKRISQGPYHYSKVYISPDFRYFMANYSNVNTVTATAVFNMKGQKMADLGNAQGSLFNSYTLPRKSLMRIKSSDGLFELPVTITYPPNFDSTKKYPVLMTVYGGPGAGKVYDEWNAGLAETYWAQQGVIQVAADNRSSGHFGKKGMDYIYRQTGIHETEDFMAVGRWLKQQPWVHPGKLCITGFSFGGYMTMMALTYGAGVFDYGVAYYGTSDWYLYDTPYAERYMGSPADNKEGYRKTAVNTYAHQYKGMLRIIHGLSDNNVHPQNSLEVASKLQELGKHFELILYPGVKHGFSGKKWLHSKKELAIFINRYLLQP